MIYPLYFQLLKEQISQAKHGKLVAEDDIPPPVFTKSVLQTSLSSDLQTSQPSPPPTVRPASSNRPSIDTVDVASAPANQARTPVVSPTQQPQPSQPSPTTSSDNATVKALKARQQEYKDAALAAKKENEMDKAITFMKIYKVRINSPLLRKNARCDLGII